MPSILIIDYGLGNLRSVQKALTQLGADVLISNQQRKLDDFDALVIPGVGAFRDGMENVLPLKEAIHHQITAGKPLLGICLGMQLLFTESSEGGFFKGLNFLPGKVIHFPQELKVPHMGWNSLEILDSTNPLISTLSTGQYVYFVHSYYAQVSNMTNVIAQTKYGVTFPSIIAADNVFATQFHPEKSGKVGLTILQNFIQYIKR
ncbi:MAG: imidazole glycerol phosphate synthase subunit HisH [Candidatus Bathyarchaeota archaeon]|nr:MAG: imidazole glycerol phosphate synthase subunit HisH [Candidatus Bathyarchaeota archaeon]